MKSAVSLSANDSISALSSSAPGSSAPAAPPRRRFMVQLAGRVLCVAGAAGLAGAAMAQARIESAAVRRFELRILQRKIAGETSTLRVGKGDTVELVWTTDETVRLHLHGYDLEAALTPGSPVQMHFQASVSGRFPIAAHGFGDSAAHGGLREKVLGYLEVHPR